MIALALLLLAFGQAPPTPAPGAPLQAQVAVERYWCTMHPDVRSATRGTCPVCRMPLVRIPPPTFASYPVDLRATPTLTGVRLRLTVRSPRTPATVRRFAIVHERPMHLFVVGDGLQFFVHEHPVQQPDGMFMIDIALPKPGPYMAIAEFLPEGGTAQTFQQMFTTGGVIDATKPAIGDSPSKVVDGLRVSIDASKLKAGTSSPLVVTVADAATGAEPTDLEPYLGARAHMLIVSADLTEAIHGHPEDDGRAALTFTPIVPRPGDYKVWVQIQRRGAIVTVPFWIHVQG